MHNEELHNVYSSATLIRARISKSIGLTGMYHEQERSEILAKCSSETCNEEIDGR
jgi:hypothetical protein